MHNKFAILDSNVVTGSYNWTKSASNNFENAIVLRTESIAKKYTNEFERLWSICQRIDYGTMTKHKG